jgi:hypothetical protein
MPHSADAPAVWGILAWSRRSADAESEVMVSEWDNFYLGEEMGVQNTN